MYVQIQAVHMLRITNERHKLWLCSWLVATVQITHNLNGTRVSHACDMRVCRVCKSVCARVCKIKTTRVHQTTRVHACKMNAPHTCTYQYEVSATKRSSLQPVVP